MSPLVVRHRFTVEDYHRMAGAGVFAEEDRVELIEGEVVQMTPIGSRHAGTVAHVVRMLSSRVGDRALVWPQNPIQLPALDSEPEPDVALLQPRADSYRTSHPQARDVLLVIEIADTSAEGDRRVKVPLYARAGIPETWLVDLGGEAIEVYEGPDTSGYRETRVFRRGESLTPAAFADVSLTVDAILG